MKLLNWKNIPAGSPVKRANRYDADSGQPLPEKVYEATVRGARHLVTWGSHDAAQAQAALADLVRASDSGEALFERSQGRDWDTGKKLNLHPGVGQAIRTKYHGPTARRGSRITATAASGIKCTIPAPLQIDGEERKHRAAAEALAVKLGWTGRMVCGGLSDGYVFVFAD